MTDEQRNKLRLFWWSLAALADTARVAPGREIGPYAERLAEGAELIKEMAWPEVKGG